MSDLELPFEMGRYTLYRCLGRGGMGVVYAARDQRLDRDVAVKMIAGLSDPVAVKRFWREARAAASVSHPNVCQIYEVDEGSEGLYLAMELLDGETLEARLQRGPCSPAEALRIARDLLGALGAMHARELVHRDVKPANVFLTRHGVKLLDFGLARPGGAETLEIANATKGITKPGVVLGTPAYMAPEQVLGGELDARSDVFSVGVVLFEMLSGRLPFSGRQFFEVANAIVHENPPALQGSPAIVAIDRVIRRSLAKSPDQRYPSSADMAAELSSISWAETTTDRVTPVRALVRVIVPPMRLLREDASLSFLSFGLAEAVSGSLASLSDVVVRSPSLAARTDGDPDPRKLATVADVDLVVLGSLLTSGSQIKANLQLVEAVSGTVLGARAIRGDAGDIFALEDQLNQSVMEMLKPHRSISGESPELRDAPVKGKAFEFFLRGRDLAEPKLAREWFEKAVAEDPLFAPAWAWLGRSHRVIGKFEEDREANYRRAEESFRRALALSPDLPVAHRFITNLETEGGRADAAIARLLTHATVNRNDAQLFAALVHACRYAGLNSASLAAHDEARRLDPTVQTSFEYSLITAGQLDRLAGLAVESSDPGGLVVSLTYDDTNRAGLEALEAISSGTIRVPPGARRVFDAVVHSVRSDAGIAQKAIEDALSNPATGVAADPEAKFICAGAAARVAYDERALELLESAVNGGYWPVRLLESSPIFGRLRAQPAFTALMETARRRREVAAAIFERNGGGTLLGLAPGAA